MKLKGVTPRDFVHKANSYWKALCPLSIIKLTHKNHRNAADIVCPAAFFVLIGIIESSLSLSLLLIDKRLNTKRLLLEYD